jgi:predicted nucleic acid binding AN1-type Zn finger protein
MPNMKLTPTRAGLVYECVDCGMTFVAWSTIPPDHECMTVFSF